MVSKYSPKIPNKIKNAFTNWFLFTDVDKNSYSYTIWIHGKIIPLYKSYNYQLIARYPIEVKKV